MSLSTNTWVYRKIDTLLGIHTQDCVITVLSYQSCCSELSQCLEQRSGDKNISGSNPLCEEDINIYFCLVVNIKFFLASLIDGLSDGAAKSCPEMDSVLLKPAGLEAAHKTSKRSMSCTLNMM